MARQRRRRGQGGIRRKFNRYYPYFPVTDDAGKTTSIDMPTPRSFKTKGEAEGWLKAARARHERCRTPDGMTAYEAIDETIAANTKIKFNTAKRYRETLKAAGPQLRKLKLPDCSPARLEKWLADLPLPLAEANKVYGQLNMAFKRLCRLELLDRNPLDNVPPPIPKRKRPKPYDKEQARRLIASLLDDPLESLYLVLLTTGIRPGEAFALEWHNVDFERKAINIVATLDESSGRPVIRYSPKTKSGERWIKLAQIAWEALEKHAANGNRVGAVWKTKRGYLFRKTNFDKRQWYPLIAKAELPERPPYSMRHTFATLGILNGVPLRVVSQMLGHASPEITLKAYSHVFDETQLDYIHKIDDIFGKQVGDNGANNVKSDESDTSQSQ